MGGYDARITPWNTTILKNHHGILQYQNNNNIIQSISMHNFDTTLNFDINQLDISHAFFRGEFTAFQTNTQLIYVSYFLQNSI